MLRARRTASDAPRPEAIAALRGEPCPKGGSPFLWLFCRCPSDYGYARDECNWPEVLKAFLSLPREERRAIRNRGRGRRIELQQLRREHLEHLASLPPAP